MPKKKKSDNNNMKIDFLFGNMQKDIKNQNNKKNEEEENKKKTKTLNVNKINKKEEKPISKNQKTKIKISEKEKEEEIKKAKPQKIINLKKEDNKKIIQKPKKYISDDESDSIPKEQNKKNDNIEDIDFSDYKMEIEEDEKKEKDFNKSKSKSKNKNIKEKEFDEEKEIDLDVDLEKIDKILREKENKSNKKGIITNIKKEKDNKKETKNKSKDIKMAKNRNTDKKDSNNSNIIGPLSNITIVITGEFNIDRGEITNILKNLGARVTGSVSSRTNILLYGERLEDGRLYSEGRKYKQAIEKHIKTLDLSSFEKYVQEKTKNPNWRIDNNNKNENIKLDFEESSNDEKNKENKNPNNNNENKGELWTSKYQPRKLSDIIGNKNNIDKLIKWLDDWNSVVLEGKKKKVETKFHRGHKPTFENFNARAFLITGDPGIGKTSSVRLIAKLKGYKVYETNASDQRNKNSINNNAGFMFNNKTLFGGELQEKNLIIMDEIDGMSGNEDRGGISAIIDIIKKTKTPIICIANDRQSPKLKTLANYCYDLKFVHPDKRMISLRLAEICKKENIKYELNALEYLCEICGNDIRQLINFIEIWSRLNNSIKFKDLTGNEQKMQGKDKVVLLSNFDAAKELLNSKSHSLPYNYLLDLFFIDYDLIPLLIYENYLFTFPSKNFANKKEELENISLASDLISESDIIDKRIRINMDWRYLSDRGLLGCCNICKINKGFVPFPKFPEALGQISSLNKIKRETNELKECFSSASGEEIRRQILPVIYTYLINYINDGNIDGILEMMKKNHITMEMFKENMTDLVNDKLKLAFDKVGTTNKSNLTRAYNKNYKTSIIRNKNKKGKNKINIMDMEKVYDENGNPLNQSEEDRGEEENDETSESVVNIQKGKNKNKGKRNRSRSRSRSRSLEKKDKNRKGKDKVKKGRIKKHENEDSEFSDV